MIYGQGLGSDCILWMLSDNIVIDIIIIIITFYYVMIKWDIS